MKAFITIGLPGSGKSTWALKKIKEIDAIYINNDEIRNKIYEELGHRKWSKEIENRVRLVRKQMILMAQQNKRDVVIDNTHMVQRTLEEIKNTCRDLGFEIECVDFTGVSIDECIRRDSLRKGYECVGEEVIRNMMKRHLNEKSSFSDNLPDYDSSFSFNIEKPMCIIVDIDGTIASRTNRRPYDEKKVFYDNIRLFVILTIESLVKQYDFSVFIFSGRTEECRLETERWLREKVNWNVGDLNSNYRLFMRENNDRRPDFLIKKELFDKHVRDIFNVFCVFDDRAQVIRNTWKPLNLPVFRVGLIDEDEF